MQKFYWGHKEILIPIYKNMSDAMKKHPDAEVLINFASLRSAYESTMETLTYPQVRELDAWLFTWRELKRRSWVSRSAA